MYRVSPLEGSPYVSRTSSRTGFSRFHAPEAARRLLGRPGSEDFIALVVRLGVLVESAGGQVMSKTLTIMAEYHLAYLRHMVCGSECNRVGGRGRWDGGAVPELESSTRRTCPVS